MSATERERVIDLTCGFHPNRRCDLLGTYDVPVRCSNCGAHGRGVFTRQHEATLSRCPDCETNHMRPVLIP